MNKETIGKNERSGNAHKATHKNGAMTVDSLLPGGSWQRLTVGVAAAAGGGLIAAAMVGVGPAALAGAAGYLAYRKLTGQEKEGAEFKGHSRH